MCHDERTQSVPLITVFQCLMVPPPLRRPSVTCPFPLCRTIHVFLSDRDVSSASTAAG